MSKPLTLKELKSLEVGEWVWIVNKENNKGYYAIITAKCKKVFAVISALTSDLPLHYFFDYGDKWLAYKNKEQAEGKEDEIRKVVAKEILQDLYNQANNVWKAIEWTTDDIKQYAKEKYGVEVDE